MNEINVMEIRQHERRYYNPAQKETPDGKRIAFVSRRNFAPGIYTMNPDGTKQKSPPEALPWSSRPRASRPPAGGSRSSATRTAP
jgi:hypothetical protein